MQGNGILLISLFLFLSVCSAPQAGLTIYPAPPETVTSPTFSLTIGGKSVPVIKHMDYHYAHFAFDGTINVKVTTPDAIRSYKISPMSLGIQGSVAGKHLSFSISQAIDAESTPRYLVLQINELEKLVILGDQPEMDVPSASGKGIFNVVTSFGADKAGKTDAQPAIQRAIDAASQYGASGRPGIVYVPAGLYIVRHLVLKDNVDLYMSPGSILKADGNLKHYAVKGSGTIDPVLGINNATNVTIRGRGEVDASGVMLMGLFRKTPPVFLTQSKEHPRRQIINSSSSGTSRNVEINGIVAKDATGWSIDLVKIKGVTVQNVKVLNHKDIRWKIQNDGINVTSSSDALVNQCFVMTIDDAMCSKARYESVGSMDNVVFANNVIWNWAAGIKAGMQNDHPMKGVVFRNIDIIHCRRAIAVDTKTSQDNGETIPIENVKFHDIRVDKIEGHWKISNHDAVEFLLEDAPARDIKIRNFTLPKNLPLRCGPTYSAKGVTFHNLVMGGELIKDVSQVTLEGKQPIEDLTFNVDAPDPDSTGEQGVDQ